MKTAAIAFMLLVCALTARAENYPPFNAGAGTQTFNPRYSFVTTQSRLMETADRIHEMGSDIIKLEMSERVWGVSGYSGYKLPTNKSDYSTLAALAANEPSYQYVFNKPFRTYIIWAYPLTISGSVYNSYWRNGLSDANRAKEYNEIKALAEHLLTAFRGTGKTFLLGHWEGDWSLRNSGDPNVVPTATAIQGMIDWLNTRQQAVIDARASVPGSDVTVYNYAEVNVVLSKIKGWTPQWVIMTDVVLPYVNNLDLVSYSAYETANQVVLGGNYPQWMFDCLDYITAHANTVAPFERDVFIGEYGMPVSGSGAYTVAQQTDLARLMIQNTLGWGCPYNLYWQMYDNEGTGYWLVDKNNAAQPAYGVHRDYLARAHAFKNLARFWLDRNPSEGEMRDMAQTWTSFQTAARFEDIINSDEFGAAWTNAQYLDFLFLRLLNTASTVGDPDYAAWLAQLDGGAPRSAALKAGLNSGRFAGLISNTAFALYLYKKTLQRPVVDTGSAEFQNTLAQLDGGMPRSELWLFFLNSEEFRMMELNLRQIDNKGNVTIFEREFFLLDFPSDVGGWRVY